MEFCVAAQKMRGLVTAIANSIRAPLRTTRRLPLLRAIVTVPAGDRRVPCNAISNTQRLACPIALQTIAKLFNSTNGFVPQDNRQTDGQFSFPEMNVGSANARHFRPDQCSARLQFARKGPFSKLKRSLE